MASLVSVAECRALVKTSLTDAELQAVINQIEAELVDRLGAFQDDTGTVSVTETGYLDHARSIFTRQAISSVTTLTIDSNAISSDDWVLHEKSGWVELDYEVSGRYSMLYVPRDNRFRLKPVIIDLVRLNIERTAMTTENVAGEYSYQAPNWEAERWKILRRVELGLI